MRVYGNTQKIQKFLKKNSRETNPFYLILQMYSHLIIKDLKLMKSSRSDVLQTQSHTHCLLCFFTPWCPRKRAWHNSVLSALETDIGPWLIHMMVVNQLLKSVRYWKVHDINIHNWTSLKPLDLNITLKFNNISLILTSSSIQIQ